MFAHAAHIPSDAHQCMVRLLKDAIKRAGLSEQQACQEMLLSQSQWHSQCSGEGHISFIRIALLPVAVKAWLGFLLMTEFGLPKEIGTFLELCGIAKPEPRPLKMQPSELQERRRA